MVITARAAPPASEALPVRATRQPARRPPTYATLRLAAVQAPWPCVASGSWVLARRAPAALICSCWPLRSLMLVSLRIYGTVHRRIVKGVRTVMFASSNLHPTMVRGQCCHVTIPELQTGTQTELLNDVRSVVEPVDMQSAVLGPLNWVRCVVQAVDTQPATPGLLDWVRCVVQRLTCSPPVAGDLRQHPGAPHRLA